MVLGHQVDSLTASCSGNMLMNDNTTPVASLADEAKAVIWRIFGQGASPLNKSSAYELIRPVMKKRACSGNRTVDLDGAISEIRGWFESHGGRPRLRPDMREPVATLILEGIRSEREKNAVWAVGSIDDADLAAEFIRCHWSSEEIDSFVEDTLTALVEVCVRDHVVDASRCSGFGVQGSMSAYIARSDLERPGKLETFSHLDNHGFELVYHGLHPAVGNLLELAVELRPEQFPLLIDMLDHPVMQARAAYRMIGAARRVDHRSTLNWIAKDSCEALIALAILHTLNTVNKLDEEFRYVDRLDADQHNWSTELRPPQDNLDAAATDLLTGLVNKLAGLEPLTCARWMGELLSHAPYVLPVRDEREIGPRNEQFETACTELLLRLVQCSWSDGLLDALRVGLRLSPRITWTRYLAEVAWKLREVDAVRAVEVARVALEEHERHVAEQNDRLYVRWNEYDYRQWLSGLGLALALSCEKLDLLHWVSVRCQALPLSVWDAEERLELFSTADRAAQHWVLVALHALPGLKELGRTIDSGEVRALAEKIWAHDHFVEQYLFSRFEASVVVELAARYAAEFGEPSDEWLLEQARDHRVRPYALWALIDQGKSKSNREKGRENGHYDEMITKELVRIASDRFDDGGRFGLEELRSWGLLWFVLGAVSEAEQTALAIVAFPLTEHDRGLKILALKLFAFIASKGTISSAHKDYIASLYDQLWSVYTPTEECGDRKQIDELLEGSGMRPKLM